MNNNLGRVHSEETKEKIRLSNIGKNKGKKSTPEANAKRSEKLKIAWERRKQNETNRT